VATITAINAESSTAGSPFEWSAVDTQNGNIFGPTTTAADSGAQGYLALYAGTGVGGFGLESFASQTVVHIKFSWRLSDPHQINGAWVTPPYFRLIPQQWYEDAPLVWLGVNSNGSSSAYRWSWGGSGITAGQTTTNWSLNTWHDIEVFWAYVGTAASVWWLSIDTATIASSITLSPSYTSCDRIRMGHATLFGTTWPATGTSIEIDNLVVYNTYTSEAPADVYSGRGIGRGLVRGIMRFTEDDEKFNIPALEGYAWN